MLLLLLLATLSAASALSRPPAPLLASRGSNQLVLYAKSLESDNSLFFEVQIYSEKEQWVSTNVQAPLPSVAGTAVALTADGLQPNTQYQFRVRTAGEGDHSPWSESSEAVMTLPTAPGIPTDLRLASSSSDSIELKWSPPLDSTAKEAPIDSYDVQHRVAFDDNENIWIDTRPVSSVESPRKKEIQLVSTTIDANANTSSGFFWLRASVGPSDVPSDPISGSIAWNATAEEFQGALEEIEGIGPTRVWLVEDASSNIPALSKTIFEWRIEFESYLSPFPLLQVHSSTLEGHISRFPIIRRLQSAMEATYKTELVAIIDNLDSYEYYDARVRAINVMGEGKWTDPVQIQTKPLTHSTDDLFFEPSNTPGRIGGSLELVIIDLQHDRATFTWPRNSIQPLSSKHELELSMGREGSGNEPLTNCSEEYFTAAHIYSEDTEVTIEDVVPLTPYCARLVGPTGHSSVVQFVTPAVPVNHWKQIHVRGGVPARGSSLFRPISSENQRCETSQVPTSRRGHSLVVVDGSTYLFGGYGRACVCGDETGCTYGNFYLNDLWHFDEAAHSFTMLREASFGKDGNWPSGRELHSATSMNDRGSFVVIGGKGAGGQVFDDVWEISVGSTVTQTILSDEGKILADGTFTKAALFFDADEDRCIDSIDVDLSLQHPCIEQIGKIDLAGPEGHRVTLFASDSVFHNDERKCEFKAANITFTDHTTKKLGDGYFLEDSIRPIQSLNSHFSGSKANGQWKIAILDTTTDDSLGVLKTWSLQLTTRPCHKKVVAQKVSVECQGTVDCFAARYSHAALAVENSVYVAGGESATFHPDAWKLDMDMSASRWTNFDDIVLPPWQKTYSESFVLTSAGLLSISNHGIYFYNVLDESWAPLAIGRGTSENTLTRDSAAYSFLEDSRAILMHGGGANASSFQYSDIWAVSLDNLFKVEMKGVEQNRAHACQLILRNTITARSRWEDILKRTWCLEQYQSFRFA